MIKKLCLLILLFLFPFYLEGADRYWVGVSAEWHDANNWATSSGGAGGAGIPTSSDDVYFDANGDNLIWFSSAFVCNNFTFEATAGSKMFLFDQGGIIYGDFLQDEGYFSATGGGGYTLEFKGNWRSNDGTFATGTGTGVDPTYLFSGTGKTYILDNTNGASYQHFTISGSYTVTSTPLVFATISQNLDISGTLTIDGTKAIYLNGSWTGQTGDIIVGSGTPYVRFFVDSTASMTTDSGTIEPRVDFYVDDDFTLPARTFDGDVYVDFREDGKSFILGAGKHYFNGVFKIYADEAAVATSAEIDCATHGGEFRCLDKWSVDTNSFKQPSQFILNWGDGVHIFYDELQLGLFGAATNMAMDAAGSTIILRPIKNQTYTYRLSRVVGGLPGVYDELTWNKIYFLRTKADSATSFSFVEGFVCREGRFEVYNSANVGVKFRNYQLIPGHDTEFDRLTFIGIDGTKPLVGLFPGGFGFHARITVNEKLDVFSVTIANLKGYGVDWNVYNCDLYATDTATAFVNFYDRDVRQISSQRNIFNSRRKLTPTPSPELIIEQLVDKEA